MANVLSTTNRARSGSAAPIAGRSATSIVGLVGDSIQTRSAPSAACSTSAVSATFTRRTVQPVPRGPLVDGGRDAEIAVVRDHHDRAGRREFQDGVRGGHPGGEGQGRPALEGADRFLERGPGGFP